MFEVWLLLTAICGRHIRHKELSLTDRMFRKASRSGESPTEVLPVNELLLMRLSGIHLVSSSGSENQSCRTSQVAAVKICLGEATVVLGAS